MAIRVFLCTWSESQNGELLQIDNPIDVYLNDVSLSAPVVGRNFYARMSLAKRPDRAYMIKVMRGNLQAAEWDALDGLAGVRMVPPGKFDNPISTIKTATRNKIYTVLDALGIPRSVFDSAATVGGFLRNMLAELGGADTTYPWELEAAEWA